VRGQVPTLILNELQLLTTDLADMTHDCNFHQILTSHVVVSSIGMVHEWVGQKLLKNYIFKSIYNVPKLSSGHHSNEYKRNCLPLLQK
jgi:hypothetical protein